MASTAKLEESENSVATAKLHVGHLLRFLEKEYKDTRLQYDRMTREGTKLPCLQRQSREILEFQNERSFNSLSVYPLRFAKQLEQMEAAFLANGRRFYELSVKPNTFMSFEGPLVRLELIPGTSAVTSSSTRPMAESRSTFGALLG
ncbi:unnamed protein product [Sphagnum jensenii]